MTSWDKTRQDKLGRGKTSLDKTKQAWAKMRKAWTIQDKHEQDNTTLDETRQDKMRYDKTRFPAKREKNVKKNFAAVAPLVLV